MEQIQKLRKFSLGTAVRDPSGCRGYIAVFIQNDYPAPRGGQLLFEIVHVRPANQRDAANRMKSRHYPIFVQSV